MTPGGGGGGGRHFQWKPYQMFEKTNAGKGYPNQGSGAESADRERVSKSRKTGKMVFKLLGSELAVRLYVERVGKLRQMYIKLGKGPL